MERPARNGTFIKATTEFNRYVESMLAKMELSDDKARTEKYIQLAQIALDKYKISLQNKKISNLAETMTECYKKLANKKQMIEDIRINAETLDIICYTKGDVIIPRERLSAGERQMLVVSLLWALALCSKRKLPVIIDTPLSRLDSKHRMSLVETYFPNASDQTILLSTDSEIFGEYYDAIKPNIGNEYTLRYDEDKMQTEIVSGYAFGR